jgi:hypothetical protein
VLIGLMPNVSIASGLRATSGTYVEVVETISLDDQRSEEDQLNAIILSRPDLIFITGGTENGARDPVLRLARTVLLAMRVIDERQRPSILYAGNSDNESAVRALFDRVAALFVSPNLRPSLEEEQLENAQIQLALAFNRQKAKGGEGFETLNTMSRMGVLPTATSYNVLADYLGKAIKTNVLTLDVGSSVGTVAASLGGKVSTSIRTEIGLGHSAPALLHLLGKETVRRWLPFYVTDAELDNYALNKLLRPATVPHSLRDLYIEHALLRAGMNRLIADARPTWHETNRTKGRALLPEFGMILGAGAAITRTGTSGFGALLLLDGIQPVGVTNLYADPYGLIAALGALALVNPEAVVQVLEGNNLERLGTVISLSGNPRVGRTAMRVRITTADKIVTKQQINGGDLWVYQLPPGEIATVQVSAAGGTNIGGRGGMRFKAEGGTVGLIFDARGRPLPIPADVKQRATLFPQWIFQMTGDLIREIDPAWLVPPVVQTPAPIVEPKQIGKSGGVKQRPTPAPADDLPDPDLEPELDLRSMLEEDTGKKGKKGRKR